ncbi:hypothetical protein DRV84_05180 [Rhodosalinus sediminis]|uniref:PH domain-containing protein n=1 Tax=Rhodosalinus sediminis TaxID=1940533 RepID=A0A3D9BWT2_9RHOB|nr:hypothetical protein [Rhodosalinus sediminis]REC57977.1 hypothetical protein DRV84_05180 [Rhodosalinus sediminis]
MSTVFRPDRGTYVRDHAWMAALAMAGAMGVLWAIGNPHVWTGAVAGLAAVGVRAWYLASEELGHEWRIEDGALHGPGGRHVPLDRIARLNTLGSAVQIVTEGGDKHLIKYLADRDAVRAAIRQAAGRDL